MLPSAGIHSAEMNVTWTSDGSTASTFAPAGHTVMADGETIGSPASSITQCAAVTITCGFHSAPVHDEPSVPNDVSKYTAAPLHGWSG